MQEAKMAGKLYGVGVGPGDPELLTLKSVRLIKEADIVTLPARDKEADKEASIAYQIAVQSVPELKDKCVEPVYMPMVRSSEERKQIHIAGAKQLEAWLDEGKQVVFLTLGDPTIYSTFTYLQEIVERDGYTVELVSGVPSFCASAARIGQALGINEEEIHVVPAAHVLEQDLLEGTYVLMKAGRQMPKVKARLLSLGRQGILIENCGNPKEKIYWTLEEIPEEVSYYSILIVK